MRPFPESVSEFVSSTKRNAIKSNIYFCSSLEFGFFNYLLIIVSGNALFSVAMEVLSIVYVIPILSCDFPDLTASDKGVLSGAALFGVICSSHLWGYLADTQGRRAVILPTLFVAFILSFVSSFVQNFYLFTLLRFLNGFL